MTYQQAVEQVREGNAQLHYDNGDLEGLRKFISDAFPNDATPLKGRFNYYYRWIVGRKGEWGCSDKGCCNLTSIKLSEIMEIKTTKERIQSAYDKAGEEGKTVLKELFPEHIKEDKSVDVYSDGINFVCQASVGSHAGKAFFLNKVYNWEVKIIDGNTLLIPTKK